MTKIKGGYYIKARAIQLSEIAIAPPHIREVWDWLQREANHAPYKNIDRGEVLCTYAVIIEGLHWLIGWRKMTYTKHHMTTAMRYLKKHLMVTTRRTTRGMVVTICNYSYYQDPKSYGNQQGETQGSTTGKLQGKPDEALYGIQEKEEEEKELKTLALIEKDNQIAIRTENFETLWLAYPKRDGRKVGKPEALKKFLKLKDVDVPLLTTAVYNLANSDTMPKDFHRFIKDRNGEPFRDWIEVAIPEGSKSVDKYRRVAEKLSRSD